MEMLTQNLEPSPEKLTKQLSESLLFKPRLDTTGHCPKRVVSNLRRKSRAMFKNILFEKPNKHFDYAKSCPI